LPDDPALQQPFSEVKAEGSNFADSILEEALRYLSMGMSIIPLKQKSKEPLIYWKEFQSRLPTKKEVEEWFKGKDNNIAIVCGSISGNLIVIDFDDIEKFVQWYNRIEQTGLKETVLNTWIVETGKGIHVYFRVKMDPLNFAAKFRTAPRFIEGVDIKAEGGYVVAPPSIHPNGKQYRFRTSDVEKVAEIDEKTLNALLNSLKPESQFVEKEITEKRFEPKGEIRELSDAQILEVKDTIIKVYKEGYRQHVALFLAGWLAKARISPVSATKIIKILHEETGDSDPFKTRLSAVVYSYKKAGIDLEPYAEQIEAIAGIKPYGLEHEINEDEIKGKSGLQEIFELILGEEAALEAIRKLEEILGVSSPFKDAVIEILDYDKQIYAIANLRKLIVARGIKEKNGMRYKERIAIGAPTNVEVYINPIGGLTKYKVVWEAATRPRPLDIGPAPIEDIVDRLVAEGLIVNKRIAHDVITAVIEGFIRKEKATIKTEIESPGFYVVDGKVSAVNVEVKKPNPEELKQALQLLDELATVWFNHARERFSLVIKWGIMAPFSYIYKQGNKWMQWLYLYGSSNTGKTTLGDIVLSLWGLDSRHRKAGSNIDTPARIGYVLSQSTFPVLVNEPGAAIIKEDIIEIIKNAVESTIVRGRYERGSYTEIPALAPLIFTSNRMLPSDDALLRRLLVVRFTYGEKISPEREKEFKNIKLQLSKLKVLGMYIASIILEKPEILEMDWEEVAIALLEKAYRDAGLEPPSWIREKPQLEEDIYEDMREAIRNFLVEKINEAYFKAAGRVTVSTDNSIGYKSRLDVDFEERVETVLTSRLIPWLILREGEEEDVVVITTGIVNEIKPVVGDIGGLKSIAELLGWEYKRGVKVGSRSIQGIIVKLEDFKDFLIY